MIQTIAPAPEPEPERTLEPALESAVPWRTWGGMTRPASYRLASDLLDELDERTRNLRLPIGLTVTAALLQLLDAPCSPAAATACCSSTSTPQANLTEGFGLLEEPVLTIGELLGAADPTATPEAVVPLNESLLPTSEGLGRPRVAARGGRRTIRTVYGACSTPSAIATPTP